ncbi:MAG: PH domain-containing protein [Phycisphaerales bacterium]
MFNALLGNASQVDLKVAAKETNHLLVPGEKIELCYKLVRDLFVFTDRRLILIDKQGVRGKKVECHSIPYKSVTHFAIETAGTFDRDAELKIFISGATVPIEKQFRKGGANIFDVQRAIATAIVG